MAQKPCYIRMPELEVTQSVPLSRKFTDECL